MATEMSTFTTVVQSSIDSVFQNGNWFATCVLSLILSAIMSSLAWMFSTAFQSNELKGWAKKELSEFIFTGALIGIAYSLIIIITALTTAYVGQTPYESAAAFLDTAQADLIEAYTHVISLKTIITFISTFEFKIGWLTALLSAASVNLPGLLGSFAAIVSNFGLKYGSPFGMLLGPLSSFESFMQPMFFAMFVQHELLNIIQKTMLPIVLPLGVLLRAFPLSRKTGSTLIAIALAAYIIYPISLIVSNAMYIEMKNILYTEMEPGSGILGELPNFDPTGAGLYLKTSPAPGKYYLNESDKFEWKALVPLNYSIWSQVQCNDILNYKIYVSDISSSFESSIYANLPPKDYVYWKTIREETITTYDQDGIPYTSKFDVTNCFKLTGRGAVTVGQNITQALNSASFKADDENTIVLAVKSEEKNLQYIDNYSFYFGDPCKEGLWSSFYCKLSASTKENELNDISYLRLTASGIKGFFSGTNTFMKGLLSTASDASLIGVALSPVSSGYLFLYLTDNIDKIMFPPLMIFFTFALTIAIFVGSFKSISQTLGGETKIIEMGRLI